jgi:hypothetical protein
MRAAKNPEATSAVLQTHRCELAVAALVHDPATERRTYAQTGATT